MMTIGSLFSGIGGLEIGIALALASRGVEHRIAWQVEAEPFCVEVLAKHFPATPRHRDVRSVRFERLERVDILCGGFPCQDVSQAGKQAGITGARSGLWSEYVRAIRELRPAIVVVENVRGLVPHLGAVLGPLAELGFDAEWTMLRASEVGAPHERARIFLLAYGREGRPPNDGARRALAEQHGNDVDRCDPHVPDADRIAVRVGAERKPARRKAGDVRTSGKAEPRHDRGVGRRSAQPGFRRGPHGLPAGVDGSPQWPARPFEPPSVNEPARSSGAPIPDRAARLHALGNAVVPQQAAAAFLHLADRAAIDLTLPEAPR
jgi:site-specific DNA-cytosine methylase